MQNARYELKLICNGQWLAQTRSWIRLHPIGFTTAYSPRQVNNIYLDTPTFDTLNANLTGVSKRKKLRLRWYGSSPQHLRPSLFNCYQREYYVTFDGAIRATLDSAQYACDQRFSPSPNLVSSLPILNTIIIEIKGAPEEIDRLQEIIGRFPIPRSRNSKYASGLLMALHT